MHAINHEAENYLQYPLEAEIIIYDRNSLAEDSQTTSMSHVPIFDINPGVSE